MHKKSDKNTIIKSIVWSILIISKLVLDAMVIVWLNQCGFCDMLEQASVIVFSVAAIWFSGLVALVFIIAFSNAKGSKNNSED